MADSHTSTCAPWERHDTERASFWTSSGNHLLTDRQRADLVRKGLSFFPYKKTLYKTHVTEVYRVGVHIGHWYIVKRYDVGALSRYQKKKAQDEVCIHAGLCGHPNVIGFYGAFTSARYMHMLMEYASKGDLYRLLVLNGTHNNSKRSNNGAGKRKDLNLPEHIAALVVAQLVDVMIHLHDSHVMHRDIKPENVLVDGDYNLRLTDFGLSIDTRHNKPNSRVGTLDYIAPEVLSSKTAPVEHQQQQQYDERADVWALGVLTYELLLGFCPFSARTEADTVRCILDEDMFVPSCLSSAAASFLKKTIHKDPRARPTMRELATDTPWLENAKTEYEYRETVVPFMRAAFEHR